MSIERLEFCRDKPIALLGKALLDLALYSAGGFEGRPVLSQGQSDRRSF